MQILVCKYKKQFFFIVNNLMRKLCLKENVSPSLLVRNSLECERHENFIII